MCNTDSYQCSCKPGYYGLHCQFTGGNCTNYGIPEDSDTLVCDCDGNRSGSECQNCTVPSPSYSLNIQNGEWVYIRAYGMTGIYNLNANNSAAFINCAVDPSYSSLYTFTVTKTIGNNGAEYTLTSAYSYPIAYNNKIISPSSTSTVFGITSCGFLNDNNGNYFLWSNTSNNITLVPMSTVDKSGNYTEILYFTQTMPCQV
jgi:hypothetical protein